MTELSSKLSSLSLIPWLMPMRPQAIAKRAIGLKYNPFVSHPFVQSDPSRTKGENKHDGGRALCLLRSVAAQQESHLYLSLFSQTQGCGWQQRTQLFVATVEYAV